MRFYLKTLTSMRLGLPVHTNTLSVFIQKNASIWKREQLFEVYVQHNRDL